MNGVQEKDALFARCDEKNIGTLDFAGVQKLSVEVFKMFARFGQQQTGKRLTVRLFTLRSKHVKLCYYLTQHAS